MTQRGQANGIATLLLSIISMGWVFSAREARAQALDRIGQVTAETGQAVAGARVVVRTVQGAELRQLETDGDGRFRLGVLPNGSYLLTVTFSAFEARTIAFAVPGPDNEPIDIRLALLPLQGEVTVTAGRGAAQDIEQASALVVERGEDRLHRLPLPTIGHALEAAPGVMLQQSAYGQVSPFLRGLTGYHVLNMIDGIRFNNATFRSGPNQYLAYIEPAQVRRMEAMLGPAGAQYGSDAMGGAIHLMTAAPEFRRRSETPYRGEFGLSGGSADASVGADLAISVGTENLAWLGGFNGRRHQDLRAGGGIDSRHVFRRFFGLSSETIRELTGDRLQDTGFQAYGWHTRLAMRLAAEQHLAVRFQQSRIEDVRGYKDLWGGLGRLQSAFEPQSLNFFYARYEKLGLGWLDSLSGTFSINSQGDGSIRQGLRATDTIIRDESRVDAYGYILQAGTHVGSRHALVFGGEIYDERITAYRAETSPAIGIPVIKRALYPNGSRYTTTGMFAQDTWEIVRRPDHAPWRANIGLRFTHIDFRTVADRNRDALGKNLGVVDSSLDFQDLTYHASLTWQATPQWALHILAGRGFRAPNLNDLGALGLNDLGYEVPAGSAVSAGGLIGAGDGEGVGSSGRAVASLSAERLIDYEIGMTWRPSRLNARVQAFHATLKDPIVRRALLFPANQAPASLAGIPVLPLPQTAIQQAQNVVSVATALDPRAVKAFVNEGEAVYYGLESQARIMLSYRWSVEGNYSFIVGRELNPNRFIRRLPPQQGSVAVLYQPSGRIWFELSGHFSGRQERLSGGDLTDERIGAARRRRDITDFFQGALVRPFLQPGGDGQFGTADDLFAPTRETVGQVRDRVLPIGAIVNGVRVVDDNTRIPLLTSTSGFAVFNLTGGWRIHENLSLTLSLRNFFDRNYRIHGSGIDAPGINGFVGLRLTF